MNLKTGFREANQYLVRTTGPSVKNPNANEASYKPKHVKLLNNEATGRIIGWKWKPDSETPRSRGKNAKLLWTPGGAPMLASLVREVKSLQKRGVYRVWSPPNIYFFCFTCVEKQLLEITWIFFQICQKILRKDFFFHIEISYVHNFLG